MSTDLWEGKMKIKIREKKVEESEEIIPYNRDFHCWTCHLPNEKQYLLKPEQKKNDTHPKIGR